MDNYIYFRVMHYLTKHRMATKSEIVSAAGPNWTNTPFHFLYEKGFFERVPNTSKFDLTYYQITEKGRNLYEKMKVFYETYDSMFSMLSIRKLKAKELHQQNVFQ